MPKALGHLRICDFTGQLAGAGSTRLLAAFGAQVIRIEDPVREGRWDILRGGYPFKDHRRGVEFGGSFQNHNVEKLGITLNLRTQAGGDLLRRLVAISDVVCENFAAGVLDRLGFGYEQLRAIRPEVIYVSNCGFGHSGPYYAFKTWGPIVQATGGLTFMSGLRDQPPAGWGYSYMDHTGAYYQAIAILMALHHRNATGEGQWIDLSCVEASATLSGPAILDYTVNGRRSRRPGQPDSNRNLWPAMAPHGIYPASGDDQWVAIACRDDADWARLAAVIGEPWATGDGLASLDARLAGQDDLDGRMAAWTRLQEKFAVQERLRAAEVPVAAVQTPAERIDGDENTAAWGMWPTVEHRAMGDVRVDGIPIRFSATPWEIRRGAPLLGQHNEEVFCGLLGLSSGELAQLHADGVV